MAYVTPTTRADGYVVDAAEYNKNTVDNVIALRTGALAMTGQAAGEVVVASSSSQLETTTTPSVDGVVFPAVQVPSAGANTLDDYEEGTWTPSLGGNATYTTQTGHYTKIGRQVSITGTITVNVIGTGSTTQITGVPFAEGVTGVAPVAVGNYASLASSVYFIGGYLTGSTIAISANTAAGAGSGTAAVFGNSASIDFSCTYFV